MYILFLLCYCYVKDRNLVYVQPG